MFKRLIVKILKKIIAIALPSYHLHLDPKRKPKAIVYGKCETITKKPKA